MNNATRGKCRDCGTKDYHCSRYGGRTDVCDACWNRRGSLVSAIGKGEVADPTVTEIQKLMASGSGKAAQRIDDALGNQPLGPR